MAVQHHICPFCRREVLVTLLHFRLDCVFGEQAEEAAEKLLSLADNMISARRNKVAPIEGRFEVANLASGTSEATLLSPASEQVKVVNYDTGHMAISDVITDAINKKKFDVLEPFDTEMRGSKKKPGIADYGKAKNPQEYLSKNLNTMLKGLFRRYSDLKGAKEFYAQLPDEYKYAIVMMLQDLDSGRPFGGERFNLGDALLLSLKPRLHSAIYIINAYGFDPVADPIVASALCESLMPGGRLILIAEKTGITLKSVISYVNRADSEFTVKEDALAGSALLRMFTLQGVSIFKTMSYVFKDDELVKAPGVTRHTHDLQPMKATIPTVRAIFQKRE